MDLEGQRRDYFGALEWVGGLMRATTPDQMDAPTPCEEFTARELMGHLIGTAHRSAGTAQGISTRHIPHVVAGVADGDLAATYESITQDIRKLWQSATDGDCHSPS
jgi:hypothetical protein